MEASVKRVLFPSFLHCIRRAIVHAHLLRCFGKPEQSIGIQRIGFENGRELGERSLGLILLTQQLTK